MNDIFIRLASLCALGLIALSQFVPTAYVAFKATLLALGALACLIEILRGRLYLLRWQVLSASLLVFGGLAYSVYGYVRGNPGAIRVLSVWFLWPLVYLLFSSLLRQPSAYAWLKNTFSLSLALVVTYSYLYLGNAAGLVPNWLYVELDQGQIVGFYEGFVEYNLYSISSLIFLVPFYSHYLLEEYKKTKKLRGISLLLLLASLVLVLLTGRRALLLVIILLPLIIIFSNIFLKNTRRVKFRPSAVTALALIGLGIILFASFFGLQNQTVIDMFVDGFDFSSSESSASERTAQFYALIEGWMNSSLLFGAGNGAAASISRSDEFPWAYELTYVYLLFSTGIVGTLFYFIWYGYGLLRLRRAMSVRPDLIVYAAPMLTGSIAFCVAAATNPYFGKFDFLWIVLLPFYISGWAKYQQLELAK